MFIIHFRKTPRRVFIIPPIWILFYLWLFGNINFRRFNSLIFSHKVILHYCNNLASFVFLLLYCMPRQQEYFLSLRATATLCV